MAFPVPERLIEAAERELESRFLPDHRARLAANNGGEVCCGGEHWQLHPVWDDTDRRRAARTASHVVHETREARDWENFPRDAIAIASNGSGDLLLSRIGGAQVERWNHETGACEAVDIEWANE